MKYKISIIVPVFNVENYIRESLESIVRQKIGLDNLEVIMVDDCSTDKSGEIIDEYSNKYHNFNSIHLPENNGTCGKARNVGIKYSTGDYIMFLDSDDYYTDDACEVLYNKIQETQVDIVFSKYIRLTDKTENMPVYPFFNGYEEIKLDSIEDNLQILKLAPSIWTKIYRRDFIIENNLEFSEDILAEDLVFVVKSFLKAKGIIFLNNHFSYYYRIRNEDEESSLSNNLTTENIFKMINGYYETYDALKANKRENFFPYIFEGHLKYWLSCFVFSATSKSEKKDLLNEIEFFFKEQDKYGFDADESYLALFDKIKNKEYDDAILSSEIIYFFKKREQKFNKKFRNSQKTNEELQIQLKSIQKKLNSRKNQVADLQTTKGWLSYKTENIFIRLKTKLKIK